MLPFSETPKTLMMGLKTISKGWAYAKKDKIIFIYSLIPILISIAFLFAGFEFGYSQVKGLLFSFTIDKLSFSFLGGFILLWVLKVFFKILSAVLLIILSYIVLQILYIPFYSFIAERVLKKEFSIELKNNSWGAFIAYTLKMLQVGLLKSLIFLLVAVLCFALSFIPPLGFLPLCFGLFVIAYDAFDYSLEILSLNLDQRFEFIRKEFFLINGHALSLGLLSFIPGLMFFFLPFAVTGGAVTIGEMYANSKQNS